jgi:cardiolipin synthase
LAPGAVPEVLTAHGRLPPARANAVISAAVDSAPDQKGAQKLVRSVEGATDAPLVAGNRVRLLVDGPETFEAVFAAVAKARHTVHVETYWFADDLTGRRFAALLAEKADQGVAVRVIYDAYGSVATSARFFDEMSDQGIDVAAFHPLDASTIWRINHRDHRKLIVVDGSVGFTGGINICDPYAEASSSKPGPKDGVERAWRDTHVEIRGPAVGLLQAYFLETWTTLRRGTDLTAPGMFPPTAVMGDDLVQVVASDGGDEGEFRIYNAYLEAIDNAHDRVWIAQAYFAPDRRLREALADAVRRGVDVRLIVPSFTNSSLVHYASRSTYAELLEAGVGIFEHQSALLHAKTAVIDGVWSTVGSSNLDRRSFIHNDELNLVVVGRAFAKEMETVFRADLANSEPIDAEAWAARSPLARVLEFFARRFAYWL